MTQDRLGSIVHDGPDQLRYYPYGEEIGWPSAQNRPKFATYNRMDSGIDDAVNRFYNPTWGRFTSPDPSAASVDPRVPGSWNKYSYVQADPINRFDPDGLEDMMVDPNGGYSVDVHGLIDPYMDGQPFPVGILSGLERKPPPNSEQKWGGPIKIPPGAPLITNGSGSAPQSSPDARTLCVNDLLMKAAFRVAAGLLGVPPESGSGSPSDLADYVKKVFMDPQFKVSAMVVVNAAAKEFVSSRAAARLAAKIGAGAIPLVGQVATTAWVLFTVREGVVWFKEQYESGICDKQTP